MDESARLESVYGRNVILGSNPSPTAEGKREKALPDGKILMAGIELGKYRHWKGRDYRVIGVALHTETREKLVLYQALYDTPELYQDYGHEPIFARPEREFMETVVKDGRKVPRFELLKGEDEKED